MKFWKILSNLLVVLEEIFPDWPDRFLSYKSLKQQLNLIYPKPSAACGDEPPPKRSKLSRADVADSNDRESKEQEAEVTKEVAEFLKLLEEEIDKFNDFFVDKEEDYVIAWKELQDRIRQAKDSNEDLSEVGKKLVDLHGEMIFLVIYSVLNYTGLVKITKKHDKRSGALIRLPFIKGVLQEPFFRTDVVNKLAKECRTMLEEMFSKKELGEIQRLESTYVKLTSLALRVLNEIRGGSSTVNPLSLPPLQSNAAEELKRVPIVEPAAAK
ncbi:SPX domain containing protein [Parasponia andersonii]|uniref:SPX domain containing protein n=1 Tax=Parasponia andersonii TaxID=3476 RepID=A0A2P5ADU6_PARAD|nr:SPX domain containing protein [Parasponia andersonii]